MNSAAEPKLEDSLKRLGEIVKSLEQNEVPLEESLKLFEEGISITRNAQAKLTEVERRIEILTKVTAEGVESRTYEKPSE